MRADGSSSSYAGSMDASRLPERAALVALLQARPGGMSWAQITADVLESGSALELWHQAVPAALMDPPGEPGPLEAAAQQIARWEDQGSALVTVLDEEYPARLRGIHQAPPVLFARGSLLREDTAVSVVGSRTASDRGLAIAAGVARELASRGVTVVAGLALGIDAAALTRLSPGEDAPSPSSGPASTGPTRPRTGVCRRKSRLEASCSPSSGRTLRRRSATS
jgi:DNA processing protein